MEVAITATAGAPLPLLPTSLKGGGEEEEGISPDRLLLLLRLYYFRAGPKEERRRKGRTAVTGLRTTSSWEDSSERYTANAARPSVRDFG